MGAEGGGVRHGGEKVERDEEELGEFSCLNKTGSPNSMFHAGNSYYIRFFISIYILNIQYLNKSKY